ncbi:MAG: hypothetical protein OMM_06050 [Candidatus Magnetoglobus multicellularis str. Araruama]|uniref:PKD domain-containing protein n=1 Tax=Candidatus Magnetoglobus multicellularis str. Araruama TaxID=890399 RepID=A0A1V1NS84_9BACT|nr:MAG: hypothetical protein OMM_06050 [Candidatus Magnetoglobus multicellularis str. Araruama]
MDDLFAYIEGIDRLNQRYIPSKVTLDNISNGINPKHINFSWSPSHCDAPCEVYYNLKIYQDGNIVFNLDDFEDSPLKRTSYPLQVDLNPNTTYSWAIYPTSQEGVSNLNVDWQTFTTGEDHSNSAPVAIFYVSPDHGYPSTIFYCNATYSYDLDDDPLKFEWNWGDGSGYSSPSSSPIASHQYTTYGKYNISLIVSDDKGASNTYSLPVTVLKMEAANQPPSVWFTSTEPSGTISYDNPIFKYDASDTDGSIVGYYRTLGSKSKLMVTHLMNPVFLK